MVSGLGTGHRDRSERQLWSVIGEATLNSDERTDRGALQRFIPLPVGSDLPLDGDCGGGNMSLRYFLDLRLRQSREIHCLRGYNSLKRFRMLGL
jgi:hypothetical protein